MTASQVRKFVVIGGLCWCLLGQNVVALVSMGCVELDALVSRADLIWDLYHVIQPFWLRLAIAFWYLELDHHTVSFTS